MDPMSFTLDLGVVANAVLSPGDCLFEAPTVGFTGADELLGFEGELACAVRINATCDLGPVAVEANTVSGTDVLDLESTSVEYGSPTNSVGRKAVDCGSSDVRSGTLLLKIVFSVDAPWGGVVGLLGTERIIIVVPARVTCVVGSLIIVVPARGTSVGRRDPCGTSCGRGSSLTGVST
jgi:hypothetical protein